MVVSYLNQLGCARFKLLSSDGIVRNYKCGLGTIVCLSLSLSPVSLERLVIDSLPPIPTKRPTGDKERIEDSD